MIRQTGRILVWSFLYFAFGKLGLLLALPPGFATSVWPPAGLALASVLIYGDSLAIAAFIGSVLTNLHVSYLNAHGITSMGVQAALGIGTGAGLQAYLSAKLIRRYLKVPSPLDSISDILRLTIGGGIVGCLINSTIGNLVLLATGFTTLSRLAVSWFTWWAGDALGVVVVCPTLLILLAPAALVSRKRKITASSSLIILFTCSAFVFFFVREWEHHRNQQSFRSQAQSAIARFTTKTGVYRAVLTAGEHFVAAKQGAVSQAEWERFNVEFLEANPEIQSIQFDPRVPRQGRRAFEKSSGIKILQVGKDRTVEVASEADVYYPVLRVAPMKANAVALGFDTYRVDEIAGTSRREAVERAVKSGEMQASAKLELVQDNAHRVGVIVYNPVSWGSAANASGIVTGVFIIPNVIHSLFLGHANGSMNLRVVDVTSGQPTTLFESEALAPEGPLEQDRLRYEDTTDFMGRQYRFELIEKRSVYFARLDWTSWAVLSIGLFANFVAGALFLLLTGENERIKKIVKEKTLELDKARLEALRQARLASLGTMAAGIAHEINNPLAVISLESGLLESALKKDEALAPLHDRIERINKMVFRIANTITGMKALSHRFAQDQLRRVSIASIVEDTLSICRERFRIGEIELTIDMSAVSAVEIYEQGGEISQVLINLLNNAFDAVSSATGARWVKLKGTMDADSSTVTLEVSDSGPGVPTGLREQIFEPFFSTKEAGGTGLGLAISEAIVKAHNGSLTLVAGGTHTAFRVTLPLAT